MHFTLRHIILRLCDGRLDSATATRMITRMVEEAGVENMLRSWIYLDNHDTPRLATTLPDERARRLAQVLQFTLPGSPNLYYGSELDMPGGDDPEMRAPMRWDLVDQGHPALDWTRRLAAVHRSERALRVGDFRPCTAHRLLAFERHTDRAADTVIVIVNPHPEEVTETVLVANSKLMDSSPMIDLLGTFSPSGQAGCKNSGVKVFASLLHVTVPPFGAMVMKPDTAPPGGYTNYKRVR
jgi:glycosidase